MGSEKYHIICTHPYIQLSKNLINIYHELYEMIKYIYRVMSGNVQA